MVKTLTCSTIDCKNTTRVYRFHTNLQKANLQLSSDCETPPFWWQLYSNAWMWQHGLQQQPAAIMCVNVAQTAQITGGSNCASIEIPNKRYSIKLQPLDTWQIALTMSYNQPSIIAINVTGSCGEQTRVQITGDAKCRRCQAGREGFREKLILLAISENMSLHFLYILKISVHCSCNIGH